MTPPAKYMIKVSDLSKRYDDANPITALEDISFKVTKGSFVSIIGPSGSGKSTVLKILSDLKKPTSGQALVNGKKPAQARTDHDFGMVFQSPVLYPWRNIARNVALPLEILGLEQNQIKQKVDQVLLQVGLSAFSRHMPSQLSGGMQQLIAVAKALVADPDILFLDEPFGALDELTRERMDLELLRIMQTTDKTVLMVTHSIREAVLLSDKIIVFTPRPGNVSKVINIDLPRPREQKVQDTEVFERCEHEVREALKRSWIKGSIIHGHGRGKTLGFPTMNLDLSAFPYRHGVYAVLADVNDKKYRGVLHYGPQATFDGIKDWIEVHLLDYQNHQHAIQIRIQVWDYLRPTVRYKSQQDLIEQMKKDCQQVRKLHFSPSKPNDQ